MRPYGLFGSRKVVGQDMTVQTKTLSPYIIYRMCLCLCLCLCRPRPRPRMNAIINPICCYIYYLSMVGWDVILYWIGKSVKMLNLIMKNIFKMS